MCADVALRVACRATYLSHHHPCGCGEIASPLKCTASDSAQRDDHSRLHRPTAHDAAISPTSPAHPTNELLRGRFRRFSSGATEQPYHSGALFRPDYLRTCFVKLPLPEPCCANSGARLSRLPCSLGIMGSRVQRRKLCNVLRQGRTYRKVSSRFQRSRGPTRIVTERSAFFWMNRKTLLTLAHILRPQLAAQSDQSKRMSAGILHEYPTSQPNIAQPSSATITV